MIKKHSPLVALAILLGGCVSPPAPPDSRGQGTTTFTTEVVRRQDLTGYSFFDGKLVIPDSAKATAFSPFDTPVLAVMTGLGKHVGRGEPIVKLTIAGADASAAAAKANVNSAQADLSAQKGASSDGVRAAQQQVDDATAAEKSVRDTVAGGGQADVAAATQARVDAEAALSQAQKELGQSLQPSKDAVIQASASLTTARADAATGIVRSPISGTVVSLEAQPGMAARSRQTLATIINFNAVRVQGLVPSELKELVTRRSHVIVAMTGQSSDPLDGRVVEVTVMPPSDGQKSPGYLAVIELLSPGATVQPRTSVKRIGVKTGAAKGVLVVPVGAITTKNGHASVKVQSGGNWVDTPVETGISDGALIEVKSGLTEGAVVQVSALEQISKVD